jgi:hypothetical protein
VPKKKYKRINMKVTSSNKIVLTIPTIFVKGLNTRK